MIEIGDIVTVTKHAGRFVVMAAAENVIPPERLWRVRQQVGDALPTDLAIGDGDLEFIGHPDRQHRCARIPFRNVDEAFLASRELVQDHAAECVGP